MLVVGLLAAVAPVAKGAPIDPNGPQSLFWKYSTLSDAFDPSVADLYADSAEIHTLRIEHDGSQRALSLTGIQWKQLIPKIMPTAREADDRNEFSDVDIRPDGDGFKITATRYSVLKCYADDQFYLVLAPNASGELKIVEEYSVTYADSQCPDTGTSVGAELIEKTITALSGMLPLAVDEETRLDEVSSPEAGVFMYVFTLVHIVSADMGNGELGSLRANLMDLTRQQVCTGPNMQPFRSAGVTVGYRYLDKAGLEIVTTWIAPQECGAD